MSDFIPACLRQAQAAYGQSSNSNILVQTLTLRTDTIYILSVRKSSNLTCFIPLYEVDTGKSSIEITYFG